MKFTAAQNHYCVIENFVNGSYKTLEKHAYSTRFISEVTEPLQGLQRDYMWQSLRSHGKFSQSETKKVGQGVTLY